MTSKFVFFDLGNVLVHFDHRILVRQLSKVTGQSIERVEAAVFESDLQNRYETGLVDSTEFARQVNAEFGTDLPQATILEAVSAIFTPNLEILPVLEAIHQRGIRMAILSNTCEAHWNWISDRQWPVLSNWFCGEILSYEVHSMKPDAGIYEASAKFSGVADQDIFFTDDRLENIQAAANRGWNTCHFHSADQLLPVIVDWLGA